jgi:hypothetical protein
VKLLRGIRAEGSADFGRTDLLRKRERLSELSFQTPIIFQLHSS